MALSGRRGYACQAKAWIRHPVYRSRHRTSSKDQRRDRDSRDAGRQIPQFPVKINPGRKRLGVTGSPVSHTTVNRALTRLLINVPIENQLAASRTLHSAVKES